MIKIKEENLNSLDGWNINSELNCLEKTFTFKSYLKNIAFVNAIAWIANKENHHPDLIIKYNQCIVQITTHDENSITSKDYDLAKKIDLL
jgi:4a-hydroxytetrahydrobiopterin dehydratase